MSEIDAVRLESEVYPVVKIHVFGEIKNGGTPSSDEANWDGDIPFITPPDLNGLDSKSVASVGRTITELGLKQGSNLVENGVIISGRAPVGYVGVVVTPSAFNQGCKAICTAQNHRYVAYALTASKSNLQVLANGTTFSEISSTALANYAIPLPPLEIQRRIADYLDRETAEIDAAVADLDRYLELLEKRKKTLAVKHIFPYGFPQNLLSASDYLALGYQSVQRIASFAKLRKKRNDDPNADYLSLLRGRGVIPYEEKGNVGNKKPQDLTTSFMVEKGDYLVNSMNFGIGSFGRSGYSGVASAAYLIFCINEELVNPDFLQFVFANDDLRAQAQNLGNGILEHRKSINWDRFRAIYVPMPQRGKQDAIVDVLSRETSELQSLIVESTKLRDLLLKRRSVLITEVVTGRKRV